MYFSQDFECAHPKKVSDIRKDLLSTHAQKVVIMAPATTTGTREQLIWQIKEFLY